MTTPNYSITPDLTTFLRLFQMQTRFAVEASQSMMKFAMMPWTTMPTGFGSICTPMGNMTVAASVAVREAPGAVAPVEAPVARPLEIVTETVEAVIESPVEAEIVEPATKAVEPVADAPAAAASEAVKAIVEPAIEPVETEAPALVKPETLAAPKGAADDLTVLNGVGPKLAEALNAEGIYHYSQIAAWTKANVAWADEALPGVRGRASRNGWVAQAAELVK